MKENDAKSKPARLEKLREKLSGFFSAAVKAFDRYVLNALALAAAIIVLVTGFFLKYDYRLWSALSTDFSADSSSEMIVISILPESVEQNMFYPVSAVILPLSDEGRLEAYTRLSNYSEQVVKDFLLSEYETVFQISMMMENGGTDMELYSQLLDELRESARHAFDDINVIRNDALVIEIMLANESAAPQSPAVLELYQKAAVDFRVCSSLLLAGTAVYVYIQAVALLFAIKGGIALLKGKKAGSAFFAYYLPGMFVLYAIGQLAGVGFNAAMTACMVIAALFGAVYVAGKLFVGADRHSAAKAGTGFAAAACMFVSACLLGSAMYSFGTGVDKIGAALGLNCTLDYSNFVPTSPYALGEAPLVILYNYLPLALFHIALSAIIITAFVKTTIALMQGSPLSYKLPAAGAILALAGYVAFFICAIFGLTDLAMVGGQLFAIAVISAISALLCYLSQKISPARDEGGQADGGENSALQPEVEEEAEGRA